MPDAPVAPSAPASAPSSPAPANEVVINPSPVSAPQPVGSQAPEKPPGEVPGSKHRPETRRESIQKAFNRAREAEATPKAPPAARPKVAADRSAGDKSAGAEGQKDQQGKPAAGERYREGGRFARVPEKTTPETGHEQPGQPATPGTPATSLPETAPYREPPGRWNDAGKKEWAAAPEAVRGEVYRMAKEFDGAYQKLRGDHEKMNTIRHFDEMATQHGTTLDKALNNYVSMEQKLRKDVFGGFDVITNNLNIMIPDGRGGERKANFADVAYSYLNRSPDQHKLTQAQNATQAAQHQIGSLSQEVADLKNVVHQLHNGLQFKDTRSEVDKFADAHPGFDELGDLIKQELDFGFSLEEAYQRAVKLGPPQTHAAQTRTTPAQTRSDKSISGAPEAGPSDGQQPRRKGEKTPARREAIQRAIQRVGARV